MAGVQFPGPALQALRGLQPRRPQGGVPGGAYGLPGGGGVVIPNRLEPRPPLPRYGGENPTHTWQPSPGGGFTSQPFTSPGGSQPGAFTPQAGGTFPNLVPSKGAMAPPDGPSDSSYQPPRPETPQQIFERERQLREIDTQNRRKDTELQTRSAAEEAVRERTFAGGESAADRAARLAELTRTQGWQSGEGSLVRGHESEQTRLAREAAAAEGLAQRSWQSGEAGAGRAFQAGESAAERAARQAEVEGGRIWQSGESEAERNVRLLSQREGQTWQSGETQAGREWEGGREDVRYGRSLKDEERRLAQLPGLWNMFTGDGGGPGIQGSPVPGSGGGSASDLIFARAKDREGLLASRALRDLKDQMTNLGLAGSGAEREAMGAITSGAAGGLNDVNIAQAIADVERGNQVEDRNYAGNLQRRSQNLGFAPSLLGLIQQRGRAY